MQFASKIRMEMKMMRIIIMKQEKGKNREKKQKVHLAKIKL